MLASLSKEGTAFVSHKYGDEIGRVAEESFESGKHAWNTFRHVRSVGAKAVAKGIAKESVKNFGSQADDATGGSKAASDSSKKDVNSRGGVEGA